MKTLLLSSTKENAVEPVFEIKGNIQYQVIELNNLQDQPFIEAQSELERLFNKNQRTKRIKTEFDIELFHTMCDNANIPRDFCLNLVTQMVIHKRTNASVLIGILHHHFEFDTDGETRSRNRAMQATADALEAAIENDFVNYDRNRSEFIQSLFLTPEVTQELDRYQYPLPMIVTPKSVKNNRSNGYLSSTTTDSLVVLKGTKADGFYEDSDVCIEHLDSMNKIPLSINTDVVHLIDNKWKDLDKKRNGETNDAYQKRLKAFRRYDSSSKDVVNALSTMRDKIWLTHKYDRRGRVYCQGYHVTYQGNEWNKAMIEFSNKEVMSLC